MRHIDLGLLYVAHIENLHKHIKKMVIFCVYMRERAKKPPNSEAYTDRKKNLRTIRNNLRTIQKKSSRLFFSLYVYVYAQRNHSFMSW